MQQNILAAETVSLKAPRLVAWFLGAVLSLTAIDAQAITLTQIAATSRQASTGAFKATEMPAVAQHASLPRQNGRHTQTGALPQWQRVMVAMGNQAPKFKACLEDRGNCSTANMQVWRDLVKVAQQLDQAGKLRIVNAFFNRFAYVSDKERYGAREYWASPAEFLRNSGDCEDYAIVKYFTLAFLGFTDNDMRVVAVMDTSRQIAHSVLAVKLDNKTWVLDNLSEGVFADAAYTHYAPKFSVNMSGRWVYASNVVPAKFEVAAE